MLFIMLTVSFTVAILLASGLSLFIIMQPKVMNWYMKKMMLMVNDMEKIFEEQMEKDL